MVSRRVLAIPLCMILLTQIGFGFMVTTGRPLSKQVSLSQAGRSEVICLMVKDAVYGPLEEKLQRWKTDKESLGASVVVKVISNESSSQIRSFFDGRPFFQDHN